MKKIVKNVFLFLCIICGLFSISSCKEKGLVNNEKTQNIIKEDIIKVMLADQENVKIEEIEIDLYLGIYNETYVAIFSSPYWGWMEFVEKIEDFEFQYWQFPILVWKDHNFYSLKDAYEKNFLSLDNIETIHNLYNMV